MDYFLGRGGRGFTGPGRGAPACASQSGCSPATDAGEKGAVLRGGHQVAARSSRKGRGLTCKMCPPRCCSKISETRATEPLRPGAGDRGTGEAGACGLADPGLLGRTPGNQATNFLSSSQSCSHHGVLRGPRPCGGETWDVGRSERGRGRLDRQRDRETPGDRERDSFIHPSIHPANSL